MAVVTCEECGQPVSNKAAACPHCGAKPPKSTSLVTWAIGGIFAATVGSCIFRENDQASTVKPSPEALAEKSRQDREVNTVLAGAQYLKGTMKKPETFELTRATMIDGKVICYEYKARNSWNDVTKGVYVISDDVSTDSAKAWNKLCAGKNGDDYTAVRAVLK
jgi:hypothetical protein